jgi:hypothetical protein
MTQTNSTSNTQTDSTIVLAGAAAEGHGALAGWRGQGRIDRAQLLAALAEAGLPEEWAPRAKSAVGHAGTVVERCSHTGLIARRARKAAWERDPEGAKRRDYAARWLVAVSRASVAGEVGASVGTTVLVAELRDASDDLVVTHADHPDWVALAERVRAEYRAARDAETLESHDVTEWLRRVLVERCGAARFGACLYVPRAGREVAERLSAALSTRWGQEWISPLLPVATSAQLAAGLARGLEHDAAQVAAELVSERADARRKQRTDVSPATAARVLSLAAQVADRADRYEPLCGAAALAPVRAALAALRAELEPLAGAAAQRFSLLELGDAPEIAAAPVPARPASARAAADRALEERRAAARAEAAPEVVLDRDWTPPGLRLSGEDYVRSLGGDPACVLLRAASPSRPARTATEALCASSLDPATDAGRLARRVVSELSAGTCADADVRSRLEAMAAGQPRWSAAAREVLALLDAAAAA